MFFFSLEAYDCNVLVLNINISYFETWSVLCFLRGGATVPIFKTQLRSVFPGPPIYFTEFILGMVISYYHIRMGI